MHGNSVVYACVLLPTSRNKEKRSFCLVRWSNRFNTDDARRVFYRTNDYSIPISDFKREFKSSLDRVEKLYAFRCAKCCDSGVRRYSVCISQFLSRESGGRYDQ